MYIMKFMPQFVVLSSKSQASQAHFQFSLSHTRKQLTHVFVYTYIPNDKRFRTP